MSRIKLSTDFWLHEFLQSETAARMGREIVPDAIVASNLTRLAEAVLQPLRDSIMTPMVITSGYRPAWLNAAVKGSKTSAHLDGRAADCNAVGMTPLSLCEAASRLMVPYDQIILEFAGSGGGWMHIGIAKYGEAPRKQLLTATRINGKVVYLPGLVEV